MDSDKPNFTLLIAGMATLYYGIDGWVQSSFSFEGQWGALASMAGGVGMCFVALSFWGDQRSQHRQYHERRKTAVSIPSIETGESFVPILDEKEQEKLASLIRNGKVMEAIKFFRESTGHNLSEAKAYIDRVIDEEKKRK